MQCDECQRELTPHRAIVVHGGTESRPGTCGGTHTFCLLCHPKVFSEADSDRYPALFDEWCEWNEAFGVPQSASSLGDLLGCSGRKVGSYAAIGKPLYGWEIVEVEPGPDAKRWERSWYYLVGPDDMRGTG